MHIYAMRLNDNLEVERFLRPHRKPSRKEQDYPSLPYIPYVLDFNYYLENQTPWHRHQAVEVVEVRSGKVSVRTSRSSYVLSPGEVCFIHPQALRQITPEPADSKPVCDLHFFQAELVTGGWGNAFDQRYMAPALDCRDLDLFYFSLQNDQTAPLKEHLAAARQACEGREYGYEFDIRREICEAWKIFFLALQPRLNQRRTISDRSEERMQTMMSFIQRNYARRIELSDIAAAAMVSERECFRCFKTTLGVTPIHYLQNYRLRRAARLLLETEDPIFAISEAVGFRDSSYFGRLFQKSMHCTPTAFRRDHRLLSVPEENPEAELNPSI